MSRKKFLKPFAASVATLVAGTQAQAMLDKIPNGISTAATESASSADVGMTLKKSGSSVNFAQHESHSSHSSHGSHGSHTSHSSSSL